MERSTAGLVIPFGLLTAAIVTLVVWPGSQRQRPLSGPDRITATSEAPLAAQKSRSHGRAVAPLASATPSDLAPNKAPAVAEEAIMNPFTQTVLELPKPQPEPFVGHSKARPSQWRPSGQPQPRQSRTLEAIPVSARTAEAANVRFQALWPGVSTYLGVLQDSSAGRKWSHEIQDALASLESIPQEDPAAFQARIQELRGLAAHAFTLASEADSRAERVALVRAAHALERRTQLWEISMAASQAAIVPRRRALEQSVSAMRQALAGHPHAQDLTQSLALEALLSPARFRVARAESRSDLAAAELDHSDQRTSEYQSLVAAVLNRTSQVPELESIAPQQLADLRRALVDIRDLPPLLGRLADDLERYETNLLPSDGRVLAADLAEIRALAPLDEGAAARIENAYRNCNLRVAVHQDMLNRLMPEQTPQTRWVRDTVLDMPVEGPSTIDSKLSVRCIPDSNAVRLMLMVHGTVHSQGKTHKGPATVHSTSQSQYEVQKLLQFGPAGLDTVASVADARTEAALADIESEFDGVPLLGLVCREIVRGRHEQARGDAAAEVEGKIRRQAEATLDQEATRYMDLAQNAFTRFVKQPLDSLQMEPIAVASHTTQDRLVLRARLAGADQLAANTPRPQAPVDSLLSVQVHQTAMNNVLANLRLEGQTYTVPELAARLRSEFQLPETFLQNANLEPVRFTFAPQNAIWVENRDGLVVLHMSFHTLEARGRKWKDFGFRVKYKPTAAGLDAILVREGPVSLMGLGGKKLGSRAQLELRGIGAKLFPKEQPLVLTPPKIKALPGLAGLSVTQFDILDGWIGVAVGPARQLADPPILTPRQQDEESVAHHEDGSRQ